MPWIGKRCKYFGIVLRSEDFVFISGTVMDIYPQCVHLFYGIGVVKKQLDQTKETKWNQ